MSDKVYRSVFGVIQFDPQEKEAAGKTVRSVVIRQVGFKEQAVNVYLTVWPSHDDVELERGDVVFAEGAYSQGKGKTDDGSQRIYHNISVTRIARLGAAVDGKRPDVDDDTDDGAEPDDIPF